MPSPCAWQWKNVIRSSCEILLRDGKKGRNFFLSPLPLALAGSSRISPTGDEFFLSRNRKKTRKTAALAAAVAGQGVRGINYNYWTTPRYINWLLANLCESSTSSIWMIHRSAFISSRKFSIDESSEKSPHDDEQTAWEEEKRHSTPSLPKGKSESKRNIQTVVSAENSFIKVSRIVFLEPIKSAARQTSRAVINIANWRWKKIWSTWAERRWIEWISVERSWMTNRVGGVGKRTQRNFKVRGGAKFIFSFAHIFLMNLPYPKLLYSGEWEAEIKWFSLQSFNVD